MLDRILAAAFFLAISGVAHADAAVPEPGVLELAGAALGVAIALRLAKRRK